MLLARFVKALGVYLRVLNRIILDANHSKFASFDNVVNWSADRRRRLDTAKSRVEQVAAPDLVLEVVAPAGRDKEQWLVELLAMIADSHHAASYLFTSGPPSARSEDPRAVMAAGVVASQLETAGELMRKLSACHRFLDSAVRCRQPLEIPQFIFDRVQANATIFTADEVALWPEGIFDRLLAAGIVEPTDNSTSVVCDACGRDHVEPVVRLPLPDGKGFRAYIMCDLEGRIAVPLHRLRQWMLNVQKLSEMTGWSPVELVDESVKTARAKWKAAPLPGPPTPAPIFEGQDFMATDFDFSAFFGDVQDVLDGITDLTKVILGLPRPPVPLTARHTIRPGDREKYDSQMATYREQHPKAMEAIRTAALNLNRLLTEDRFVEPLAGVWPPSAPKDLADSMSLGLRNALAAAQVASKCTSAPAGSYVEGFKRSAVTAEYTLTGIVAKLKERPEVAQLAYERARSKLRRPGSGLGGSAGTTPLVAPDPLTRLTEALQALRKALADGPESHPEIRFIDERSHNKPAYFPCAARLQRAAAVVRSAFAKWETSGPRVH